MSGVDFAGILIVVTAGIAAYALTIVPLIPGTLFVPIGALAVMAVDESFRPGWWFWVLQVLLVAMFIVVDNVAQWLGVKRYGGSRLAMFGGAVGVIAGPILLAFVSGPFALLLGPPIGAVVGTLGGELIARKRAGRKAAQNVEAIAAPADGVAPEPASAALEPAIEAPSTARGMVRLGVGALVAWAVGTSAKLVLVSIQIALLVVLMV